MPVGCWDKSETCYAEYSEVLKDLQAKVTPNARTEEELAAIDLRYYFGHTHKRKRKTENKKVFWLTIRIKINDSFPNSVRRLCVAGGVVSVLDFHAVDPGSIPGLNT